MANLTRGNGHRGRSGADWACEVVTEKSHLTRIFLGGPDDESRSEMRKGRKGKESRISGGGAVHRRSSWASSRQRHLQNARRRSRQGRFWSGPLCERAHNGTEPKTPRTFVRSVLPSLCSGDSCRIQTCDLLIRSQMLYSAELRSQVSGPRRACPIIPRLRQA